MPGDPLKQTSPAWLGSNTASSQAKALSGFWDKGKMFLQLQKEGFVQTGNAGALQHLTLSEFTWNIH